MGEKEFLDNQFELTKDSKYHFSLMAQTLKYCGEIIYKKIKGDVERHNKKKKVTNIDNVLAMLTVGLLYSYAFENILKSVIRKQKGSLFCGDIFKYKDHDLNNLAGKTNLLFSDNENQLFKNLTVYGEWMGRYPIPLKKDQMKIGKPEDINSFEFNQLFSRLKKESET